MATAVEVAVTGIVMFIAGSTINSTPPNNMHAAIAIEDNARPNVNKVTRFQMALPIHHATVKIADSAVKDVTGNNKSRAVKSGGFFTVTLEGDQVQFGRMVSNTCTPFAVSGAFPHADFEKVPHLSAIVGDVEMGANTLPLNGKYGNISKTKISGWLDIHGEDISAEIADEANRPAADFRPSRHAQKVATTVRWKFKVDPNPACIAVTPFNAIAPDVVIEIMPQNNVTVHYANMAPVIDAAADLPHPGITYDWELFYDVLKNPPTIPPLPYVRIKTVTALKGYSVNRNDHAHGEGTNAPQTEGDDLTGINCGPVQTP